MLALEQAPQRLHRGQALTLAAGRRQHLMAERRGHRPMNGWQPVLRKGFEQNRQIGEADQRARAGLAQQRPVDIRPRRDT